MLFMKKLSTSFLLLLMSITGSLVAQDTVHDKLKEELIKDWERARGYTKSFLDAMPADKYSWQPTQEVRSFAKQMLHLAYINVGWMRLGTDQNDFPKGMNAQSQIEETVPQTKDSVSYYAMASYDLAIEKLKKMDASKLFEMTRGNASHLTWIKRAFEHQTHQRAQCVTYLRLVGIKPPHTL